MVGLVRYGRLTGTSLPGLLEVARAAVDRAGTDAQRARLHQALGDLARARSDHDTAHARFEQALLLYQQTGDVLGEAASIQGLGDIALARSDHDTARTRFQEALALYERTGDPYSIGWAQHRLARVASPGPQRDLYLAAAREAWLTIDRTDLVEALDQPFEPSDEDV